MGNLNDNNLYTNQENTWAAQIAYCNIDDKFSGSKDKRD